MSERNYKATITKSSRELSVKEKIAFKDTGDAVKLDDLMASRDSFTITPDVMLTLAVHNEMSDNKDYNVFVIVDKDGTKYTSSSESLITAVEDIDEEASKSGLTEYAIKILKKPSKNYAGRFFFTATIA